MHSHAPGAGGDRSRMDPELRRQLVVIAAPNGWQCHRCRVTWRRATDLYCNDSRVFMRCQSCGSRVRVVNPPLFEMLAACCDFRNRFELVSVVSGCNPPQAIELSEEAITWPLFAMYREVVSEGVEPLEAARMLGACQVPEQPKRRKLYEEVLRERMESCRGHSRNIEASVLGVGEGCQISVQGLRRRAPTGRICTTPRRALPR